MTECLIISADGMDVVVDMAKGCPALLGGATITLDETFAAI